MSKKIKYPYKMVQTVVAAYVCRDGAFLCCHCMNDKFNPIHTKCEKLNRCKDSDEQWCVIGKQAADPSDVCSNCGCNVIREGMA